MKKLALITMGTLMLIMAGISAVGCSGSNSSTMHSASWGHNASGEHFTRYAAVQSTSSAWVWVLNVGNNLSTAHNGAQAHARVRAAATATHNHDWWN